MNETYYYQRNGELYTKYTKREIWDMIDPRDTTTFFPFLQDMNYPYIEEEWKKFLDKYDPKDGRIIGRYIALMRLKGYQLYTWSDSAFLNELRQQKNMDEILYMEEVLCYGDTLPIAYHSALEVLQQAPIVPCPDWNTNQKEISVTMVVGNPLKEPMISKLSFCDPDSLEQYRQEMLDGILDFEVNKGNWKYTYHDRMVGYPIRKGNAIDYASQLYFVIEELRRNPYSRRAVIDIRDNTQDMYSDDPACWQHAQFFIRDNKLYMKVLFRSNDACKAAFMNAFALIMLQKRIADELGVEMGTYTHRANSFHCYERDFDMLDGYVNRIAHGSDVTYSYEDDWKELMEEARPEIAKKVEFLKNK